MMMPSDILKCILNYIKCMHENIIAIRDQPQIETTGFNLVCDDGDPNARYIQFGVYDEETGDVVVTLLNLDGTPATPVGNVIPCSDEAVQAPHSVDGHVAVIPVANTPQVITSGFSADTLSITNPGLLYIRATVAGLTGNQSILLLPGATKNLTVKEDVITSVTVVVVDAPAASGAVSALTPTGGPLAAAETVDITFLET